MRNEGMNRRAEEKDRGVHELERRGWDEEGESSEITQCEQQRIEPETESMTGASRR